jgi:hypothetical protein
VRVVTSEIDDHVDDKFAVVPCCGELLETATSATRVQVVCQLLGFGDGC